MYAVAASIIVASTIGLLFGCCGKVLQLFAGTALFILWIIIAILCVVIAIVWASARGSLPDLNFDTAQASFYDVPGEPGAEWKYVPSSSATVEWQVAWACILTYVGAALAIVCAVCAFFGIKDAFDGIVIRVEMQSDIVDSDGVGGMFVDAAIGTTGVIKGMPMEPALEQERPAGTEVTVEVHANMDSCHKDNNGAQV